MTRTAESDIEQLNIEVALPHLVEAAGIVLEQCGDDYIATGHFREETGYAESILSRARRAAISTGGGQ